MDLVKKLIIIEFIIKIKKGIFFYFMFYNYGVVCDFG